MCHPRRPSDRDDAARIAPCRGRGDRRPPPPCPAAPGAHRAPVRSWPDSTARPPRRSRVPPVPERPAAFRHRVQAVRSGTGDSGGRHWSASAGRCAPDPARPAADAAPAGAWGWWSPPAVAGRPAEVPAATWPGFPPAGARHRTRRPRPPRTEAPSGSPDPRPKSCRPPPRCSRQAAADWLPSAVAPAPAGTATPTVRRSSRHEHHADWARPEPTCPPPDARPVLSPHLGTSSPCRPAIPPRPVSCPTPVRPSEAMSSSLRAGSADPHGQRWPSPRPGPSVRPA